MAAQYVWEAAWSILVEKEEQIVTQLFAAKDLKAAFFKARKWAEDNVGESGEFQSISKKQGMVI